MQEEFELHRKHHIPVCSPASSPWQEIAKLKQAYNSGLKARIWGKAAVRDAKQPLIGEAFQAQGPLHVVRHCGNKQLTDVMCYFFVKDKHAFDTVNDAGFRHLVWELEPRYLLPTHYIPLLFYQYEKRRVTTNDCKYLLITLQRWAYSSCLVYSILVTHYS